jgi:hypothetical protein
VVQFGVVQACEQVSSAGAAGRQTDPDLTGELGMGDCHEGRHLFVADLDEFDLVGALQRSDNAVDAIAGTSVDSSDLPSVQAFNDEVADFHGKLR